MLWSEDNFGRLRRDAGQEQSTCADTQHSLHRIDSARPLATLTAVYPSGGRAEERTQSSGELGVFLPVVANCSQLMLWPLDAIGLQHMGNHLHRP